MSNHPIGHIERGTIVELAMIPLFSGLAESDLRALLGEARTETHADGFVLFAKGDPADRFFVVLDGHVELFIDEGGRRSVLEVAKRPAVLGEAGMFVDGRYPNAARVVGHAKLLVVPSAPFLTVLDENFDLARRMLGSMAMRLRGLVGHIAELKLKSTAQRLAGFLLGLTAKTEGAAVVRFPYDKRLAAENLGMTAESLSRALLRLGEHGVESRADNVVAIADLAVLRTFCIEEGE
ncbi:MAG TPA: cyclic nucleotide-binding domain-containing protein [Patescibacteria group bacterium]|nr:cyclic nucleotide-binding domain-containing protein [Patescibacteria group bacterium]